jgi:DNA polymerase type B, organellar and viral
MTRTSPDAIARNREKARERYRKYNAEKQKQRQAEQRKIRYEERPFIGWDSEGYDYFISHSDGVVEKGPQRTMLFGCSIPGEYITGMELSSREMLDLILRVESLFPDAFHVGFSFEYDVNQVLKDLPWRFLAVLKETGHVRWEGYRIAHVPHKIFTVSRDGVVATIYDVFGYFHSKYVTALLKYGVGNREKLQRIIHGKERRGHFTWADIDEVTTYWKDEISLLPDLMDCVRIAAYGGGFRIGSWHGPGALAAYALRHHGVRGIMSRKTPANVKYAIRAAYCGGRFQAWQCGWYEGDIYTLDKNSAYVQAIAMLPDLSKGEWEHVSTASINGPGDIARFGLYYIDFDAETTGESRKHRANGYPDRPYPLFHRSPNGMLSWPSRTSGWYWSPEAKLIAGSPHARITEAYVFRDNGQFPFSWVKDAYHARLVLQRRGDPAEKAFKWSLAAMYGAFARRVGWDKNTRMPPRSHELAWAGYITSHCRAAIYDVAAYAYANGGLISVDTDGVTATVPFPENLVPEGFGEELGQWKQDHYSAILFWQNGIYWLRDENGIDWKEAKSRGIPKGTIPLETAMSALQDSSFVAPFKPANIVTTKTKYVGYRAALGGKQFGRWRHWIEEKNTIAFGGLGKGTHLPPFCNACRHGTKRMHTVTHFPPREMESSPHKLPWLEPLPDTDLGELASDIFATESEIFMDDMLEDRL